MTDTGFPPSIEDVLREYDEAREKWVRGDMGSPALYICRAEKLAIAADRLAAALRGGAATPPNVKGSLSQGWTDAEIVAESVARAESPARFYANPVTEAHFVMAVTEYVSRVSALPAASEPNQERR